MKYSPHLAGKPAIGGGGETTDFYHKDTEDTKATKIISGKRITHHVYLLCGLGVLGDFVLNGRPIVVSSCLCVKNRRRPLCRRVVVVKIPVVVVRCGTDAAIPMPNDSAYRV